MLQGQNCRRSTITWENYAEAAWAADLLVRWLLRLRIVAEEEALEVPEEVDEQAGVVDVELDRTSSGRGLVCNTNGKVKSKDCQVPCNVYENVNCYTKLMQIEGFL